MIEFRDTVTILTTMLVIFPMIIAMASAGAEMSAYVSTGAKETFVSKLRDVTLIIGTFALIIYTMVVLAPYFHKEWMATTQQLRDASIIAALIVGAIIIKVAIDDRLVKKTKAKYPLVKEGDFSPPLSIFSPLLHTTIMVAGAVAYRSIMPA